MISTRDSPNPLRPYYRPPSIGLSENTRGTTSSGTYGLGPKNSSASSYASSARRIFSDIGYNNYMSESSHPFYDSFKKQIDELLYRYVTVIFAQPFDVAKTILQVKIQGQDEELISAFGNSGSPGQMGSKKSYQSDDSDPDESAYFTAVSQARAERLKRELRQYERSPSLSPPPMVKSLPAHQLRLKTSDSIIDVLGEEWIKEGVQGVWKASNITFIYGILLETLEKWTQGLLSAIFNVPEPGLSSGFGMSIEIPFSWMSLGISVVSAVASGVILAPLDLIRTKLMMTPISHKKRFLLSQQQELNPYFCHSTLLIPTILYSLVTPTVAHCTSLFLGSYASNDPVLTLGYHQLAQLLTRFLELFLKLPLETILRRAQIDILKRAFNKSTGSQNAQSSLLTTVSLGEYRGVIGTMWLIIREEGVSVPRSHNQKRIPKLIKGQGLAGLWRGWRVGIWGLVGVWGLRVVNGSGGGIGEF